MSKILVIPNSKTWWHHWRLRETALACAALVGLLVGALLWKNVALPLDDDLGVIGILPRLKFNPVNNLCRFALFTTLPALFYLAAKRMVDLFFPDPNMECFRSFATVETKAWNRLYIIVTGVLVVWAFICVTTYLLDPLVPKALDFLHEGESLDSALNFRATGKLWTGTFFMHGAFYDPLTSVLGWKLFAVESIGSSRLMRKLLIQIIPVCLCIFLLALTGAVKSIRNRGDAVLCASLIFCAYLISNQDFQNLDRRDSTVLLGLAALIAGLASKRTFWMVLAGFASPICFFHTIDRGAYYFASCVLTLACFAFLERNRRGRWSLPILWLGSCIIGFAVLALSVGREEWSAFLTTTLDIYRFLDLLYGFVFPSPLDTSQFTTHTLPMILIALQALEFVRGVPAYLRERNATEGSIHLLIVLLSIFYFRSSLGRSDLQHVKYGSTFAYLGTGYVFYRWLRHTPTLLRMTLVCMALLPAVVAIAVGSKAFLKERHTLSAIPQRMVAYSKLLDEAFLSSGLQETLGEMRDAFSNEKCVFVFSGDGSWNYLLRRPSCSRFIELWFSATTSNQTKVIADLERTRPKLILYDSPAQSSFIDGFKHTERLPLIDAYIRGRYQFYRNIGSHIIYRRADENVPQIAPPSKPPLQTGYSLRYFLKSVEKIGWGYKIGGWVFLDGFSSKENRRFIVLRGNRGDEISVRPLPEKRNNPFPLIEFTEDVDSSGFVALVDSKQLVSDRYEIGFWVKNGEAEGLKFSGRWLATR